jgi:hypothetical protein
MTMPFAASLPQSGMALADPGAAPLPLDALPWLAPGGSPTLSGDQSGGSPARRGMAGIAGMGHRGLAGTVAAVIGCAWLLAGASLPQAVAPSVAPQPAPPVMAAAAPPAAAEVPLDDALRLAAVQPAATASAPAPLGAPVPAPVPAKPAAMRQATPRMQARTPTAAAAQPASLTSIPAQQVLVTGAAGRLEQAPSSSPDSAVTAATRRQFRMLTGKARDAARDVIRLGDRRRPGRDTSAHAEAGYRLRQHNAEAARGYLDYLDTLSRSMKGTTSETVAQQSLAKARQTLGYLATMEADSQASLR